MTGSGRNPKKLRAVRARSLKPPFIFPGSTTVFVLYSATTFKDNYIELIMSIYGKFKIGGYRLGIVPVFVGLLRAKYPNS